jgi:hypothetical protein
MSPCLSRMEQTESAGINWTAEYLRHRAVDAETGAAPMTFAFPSGMLPAASLRPH